MTPLDTAIREEMKRQGCERWLEMQANHRPDIPVCWRHNGDGGEWDDERGECSVVGSAFRAGWNAAIREALATLDKKHDPNLSVFFNIDLANPDHVTELIRVDIRSLLPDEGGDDA